MRPAARPEATATHATWPRSTATSRPVRRGRTGASCAFSLLLVLGGAAGCDTSECATADLRDAECRVLAERRGAELRTSQGHRLRFVEATATDGGTETTTTGLLQELDGGQIYARAAGFGDVALAIDPAEGAAGSLQLDLRNVAPTAELLLGPWGSLLPVPEPGTALSRTVEVPLDEGPLQLVLRRTVVGPLRLAVTADVQTNPGQFERLIDALHEEGDRAEAAGAPLLGLIVLGDLSEDSSLDELEAVRDLLDAGPVPSAVTPGNHDVYDGELGAFTETFGPGNHRFDVGSARVVLLDSGLGDLADSVELSLPERLDRGAAGVLVAGMHYPPFAGRADQGFGDERTANRLLSELARQQAELLLAGHIHDFRDFGERTVGDHTIREVVVGTGGAEQGLGQPLFGFLRVEIDGATWSVCFVETPPAGAGAHPREDLPYCADTR